MLCPRPPGLSQSSVQLQQPTTHSAAVVSLCNNHPSTPGGSTGDVGNIYSDHSVSVMGGEMYAFHSRASPSKPNFH